MCVGVCVRVRTCVCVCECVDLLLLLLRGFDDARVGSATAEVVVEQGSHVDGEQHLHRRTWAM